MLNCGGPPEYGCCGCWYASGVYCKGGALDGRRAWPRRGVLYCGASGAGAELAMATGGAVFGQGVVGVCSSRSVQLQLQYAAVDWCMSSSS